MKELLPVFIICDRTTHDQVCIHINIISNLYIMNFTVVSIYTPKNNIFYEFISSIKTQTNCSDSPVQGVLYLRTWDKRIFPVLWHRAHGLQLLVWTVEFLNSTQRKKQVQKFPVIQDWVNWGQRDLYLQTHFDWDDVH